MAAPRIVAMKAGQNDTLPRPTKPPIPTSTSVLGENRPTIGKASPADTINAAAIARFGCSPIKFSKPCRYAVTAIPSALRFGAACRRRHEFRPDRIGDRLAQDPIDLGLGGRIEPPARHPVDRLQLIGMTRAPQR